MKSINLFLRDAGVVLDNKEVNFLKRFYRCVELAEKNGLYVQITLDEQYFLSDHLRLTNELTAHLQIFEKVLIHLHTSYSKRFGRNAFTDDAFLVLADFITKCGNIRGVCVHPDHIEDFSVLERLKINDIYVAIEILGKEASFGNHFSEIADISKNYDFLDFVLDTAHVVEMEETGEPGLGIYFETFRDKIKEIHISQTGNLYDPEVMGADFVTSHSLLTLKDDNLAKSLAALNPAGEVNTVIEGVTPPGEYGETCLRNEVTQLRKYLCG